MSATKLGANIWTAETLIAGAADTDSGAIDISAGYGVAVMMKLTNGGTGPTFPAQVQIWVRRQGSAIWYKFKGALTGTVALGYTSSWTQYIPIGFASFKIIAGDNTDEDVAVSADYEQVTALV